MRTFRELLSGSGRFALLAVLLAAASGAASAGQCISAGVDEVIRLPDGSRHNPGTLKLCLDRDFSPVSSLHTASIGKRTVGFLTSRRAVSEGAQDEPFMMFVRNAEGALQLYGYAIPSGSHMNTYLLQSPPRLAAAQKVAVSTASLSARGIPAGAE